MFQEYHKMIEGRVYNPEDKQLIKMRNEAHQKAHMFNSLSNDEARHHLVKELFESVGENFRVEGGLRIDYGQNISIGDNFFANFDCVFLDSAKIKIGKNAKLGSKVSLITPHHPLKAEERDAGLESAHPITIGDNVWIGSSTTIVGNVTLGDNVVVAAGSVVMKSFGDNVLIGGNPAEVIKKL